MTNTLRSPSPALRLALDYGPLLIFLAISLIAPGEPMRRLVAMTTLSLSDLTRVEALLIARVIVATAAFIVATIVAMIVSRLKLGSISPMLWISGVLVILFGGLTIYFRDPHFIKMKPTIVNTLFGLVADGAAKQEFAAKNNLLDFLKDYDADVIYLVGDIVDMWALRQRWTWPATPRQHSPATPSSTRTCTPVTSCSPLPARWSSTGRTPGGRTRTPTWPSPGC